jgi:hypothetical protein
VVVVGARSLGLDVLGLGTTKVPDMPRKEFRHVIHLIFKGDDPDLYSCNTPFTLDVRAAKFYQVHVPNFAPHTYSKDDLDAGAWKIRLG